MEVWKYIKGYEGLYQISNLGRVKSLKRNILLKKKKEKTGYNSVYLFKNGIGKYWRVHRLVCVSFIPNPNNYPIINHINGIKDDNKLDNLEWCTVSYNTKDAYDKKYIIPKKGAEKKNSKLTDEQVLIIRNTNKTQKEISIIYNISKSLVSLIKNKKRWSHI